MGGGGKTTTTTVNKTELPQWVNDAGKANYDYAKTIGGMPQWTGSTLAPESSVMRDAIQYAGSNRDAGTQAANDAYGMFTRLGSASAFSEDLPGYLNPYIGEVENKALGALDDSRRQSLMQNADNAVKARAFGGTRSGIVDAVTNAEAAKQAGILSSTLRKEGFDTAVTNRNNALSTAGQGLLSTSDTQTSNFLKNLQAMMQAGSADQTRSQAELDDQIGQYESGRNNAIENLNLRLNALGMTPYNTTTSGTSTTKQPSSFDPASLILGVLSLGLGL